eukprot:384642-Pelagomonas_calceolata.AAC.2
MPTGKGYIAVPAYDASWQGWKNLYNILNCRTFDTLSKTAEYLVEMRSYLTAFHKRIHCYAASANKTCRANFCSWQ